MSDAVLVRLAREDPAAEMVALPFSEITARIEAVGVADDAPRRRRARRWERPRRAPFGRGLLVSLAGAAAAVAIAAAIVGQTRSVSPRSGVRPAAMTGPARIDAAHFAVLRSAPGPAMSAALLSRVVRVLGGRVAETRRIVAAHGTIWVVVGIDGRLCVTLVAAGHAESFEIACGSEAQAIRVGVRVAGRLGAAQRYVAGVVPDRLSRVTVHTNHDRRLVLTVHDNVYATTLETGHAAGSPAA